MGNDSVTMLFTGMALGAGAFLILWTLISLVAGKGAFSPLGLLRGGIKSRAHCDAAHALEEFSAELESVQQKFNILAGYITEYFNTFQAAGWDELRVLLDDLQLIEDSLKLLLESRRYQDVKAISRYLMGRLDDADRADLLRRYDGLEPLRDWRQVSHAALLRVVRASMDSAQRTAAVGISRKRPAKPTLVTLAELRSVLGDMR